MTPAERESIREAAQLLAASAPPPSPAAIELVAAIVAQAVTR